MTSRNRALFDELAHAFPRVQLEPSIFVDPTGLWARYIGFESFESKTMGRSWDLLDPAFVESHDGALRYMNVDTFVAVVPAYLKALVELNDAPLPPLVVSQLLRTSAFAATFEARLARLTPPQRQAIHRTLELSRLSDRFTTYYKDGTLEPRRACLAPVTELELLDEIVEVFPQSPIEAALFADSLWKDYVEVDHFEAGSLGRTWKTLEAEFLEFHAGALRWMTVSAFASILPAYLAALIRGKSCYELPPLVLVQLTRIPEDSPQRFEARQKQLTGPQRHTIARALDVLSRTDRFAGPYDGPRMVAAVDSWRPFQVA